MWPYLSAAFFLRPDLPGLGQFPVNLVALAAAGILGFINPGFWLLGAAAEIGYLYLLAFNPRFRRIVDAGVLRGGNDGGDIAAQRRSLVALLDAPAAQRLSAFETRCAKVLDLQRRANADDPLISGNADALQRFGWTMLKLLVARANLTSGDWREDQAALTREAAGIEAELAGSGLTPVARESRGATLAIVRQRLDNLATRARRLQEIDADLARLEAAVELARERAAMAGQPQAIVAQELSYALLDSNLLGDAAPAIGDLDRAYGVAAAAAPAASANAPQAAIPPADPARPRQGTATGEPP
jgi:hypothetical protein